MNGLPQVSRWADGEMGRAYEWVLQVDRWIERQTGRVDTRGGGDSRKSLSSYIARKLRGPEDSIPHDWSFLETVKSPLLLTGLQ